VAQCGVYLGDINADGEFELVVGTTEGDLYIYKGISGKVWKRSSNLGFLTAIGVGDLLNTGMDVLVATSGCGWLYIFDFSYYGEEEEIEPTYKQRVPANIRDLIISDINDDGSRELVVSLTDRVVRMYRWIVPANSASPNKSSPKENADLSFSSSSQSINQTDGVEGSRLDGGRFICINKWEFASQIGTISFNKDTKGEPAILIGQPGGAFMRLRCKKPQENQEENIQQAESAPGGRSPNSGRQPDTATTSTSSANKCEGKHVNSATRYEGKNDENEEDDTKGSLRYVVESPEDVIISSMSVEYEPMGIQRRANPNVSSEVLGGFHSCHNSLGTRYACVTLDGSVLLVEDCPNKKPVDCILWNLQVDHQLMCLSKLDLSGDGLDEAVVCCSWDGQTYIISQDKQAVRFKFEDSVSTFTAGNFTLGPLNTQPVLVYVTFDNRVKIYYDLCLGGDLRLSSLIHYEPMTQEAASILSELGCEPGNLQQLQQVYSYCLYGMPVQNK